MSKTYLDKSGLTYFWGKIKTALTGKQDSLVSGTNIKTINNTTLLGSGNISVGDVPIGTIMLWSTDTAPSGWLLCRGQRISKTTYADLYSVIGNNYGELNDDFLLPDLQGYVPVGKDNNDTDFDTLGKTGGEKTHQLITDEIPSHSHLQYAVANKNTGGTGIRGTFNGTEGTGLSRYTTATQTGGTGGGLEHNNLQPYITLNYIIKYQ